MLNKTTIKEILKTKKYLNDTEQYELFKYFIYKIKKEINNGDDYFKFCYLDNYGIIINILEEIDIFLLKLEKNKFVNIPDIYDDKSKKEYLLYYKDYLTKILKIINHNYITDSDLNKSNKELYEKYIIN